MLDAKTASNRAFCCGKTFRVYYPQRTTHSDTFWLDWLKNVSHYNQQGQDGQTLVMCIQPALSRGESSMLNTSELPNDAVGCLLWQVLDREVSPKYSLSAKACAGILRRAEARKKILPPTLKVALERISDPQWGGVVTASGGALGGGSETLVVHGTQDPIISSTTAHCLGRNGGQENILFDIAHRSDVVRIQDDDTTPTLTARMGTGGNNIPCIALAGNTISRQPHNGGNGNGFDGTQDPITSKNIAHCLGGNLMDTGGGNVPCLVLNDQGGQSLHVEQHCISPTLRSEAHGNLPIIMTSYIIRKLTPVECERLMGFPDNYTCIPWYKKSTQDCPDSPRYKAIGNSMATPVIKWIGERMISYIGDGKK